MSKNTKTVTEKPVKKAPAKTSAAKSTPKAAPAKIAEKKPAAKVEEKKAAAKPAVEKKPAAVKAPAKKPAEKKAAKEMSVVLTTPTAYELASKVTVAGSFNEWNQGTAALCKKDKKTGLWSAKLSLAAGTYQYKFICDDQYWDEGDNKVIEVK